MSDPSIDCKTSAADVCTDYATWLACLPAWMHSTTDALSTCYGSAAATCVSILPTTPTLALSCSDPMTVGQLRATLKQAARAIMSWAEAVTKFVECVERNTQLGDPPSARKLRRRMGDLTKFPPSFDEEGENANDVKAVCRRFYEWGECFADWGSALADWDNAAICGRQLRFRHQLGGGITRPPWPPWGSLEIAGFRPIGVLRGEVTEIAGMLFHEIQQAAAPRLFPDGVYAIRVDLKLDGIGELAIEIDGKKD